MGAHVRVVELGRHNRLERYRGLEHTEASLDAIEELAADVARMLGTGHLWMLNSTQTGGGVADMLPRLCELLNDAGVDTRWLILEPADPEFFAVTKTIHNMIHGLPPSVPLDHAREVFERVSREAAESLAEHVESDDVLAVHDPQPLGAAAHLSMMQRPQLIWRSHIGLPHHNEHTETAWNFLEPYLTVFDRLLFSSERYIPSHHTARSGVLHPAIDPLSHKNRLLRSYKLVGILRSAELVEGPPVPDWARFHAPARRYVGRSWEARPIDHLLHVPAVLQISRFDRLKGFHHLIPAFAWALEHGEERAQHMRADTARSVAELGRAVLLLGGPDPAGVIDDPEADQVLEALCRQHDALPSHIASRVHILRLPMYNQKENALIVNALQRMATVVVQNSLEEGFGLTVTEAMWKGVPMVASDVGGISIQIRPTTDGLLIEDPEDHAALGEAILEQLFLRARAETMARSAQRRVSEHFLVTTQVRRWLEETKRVLSMRPALVGAVK